MTNPEPSQTSRDTVLAAITAVAPEAEEELAAVAPDADLFEALGLDSMDHLSVMTEIAQRTGVEIAEREYGRLRTIASLTDRIGAQVTPAPPGT